MNHEVLVNDSFRTIYSVLPTLFLSVGYAVTDGGDFWYIIFFLLLVLCFYFYFKEKERKMVICNFDGTYIFFPTIGRQLKIENIDKIEIYKSKITFFYIIKIFSNAYDNDILKLKVTKKEDVFAILNLFKGIHIDESLVKSKI